MLYSHQDALIGAILLSPRMQRLWDAGDRGMPVFAHSIDVALLCLDRLEHRHDLDRLATVVGALIHDASKLPDPRAEDRSHSWLMRTCPDVAADISLDILTAAERSSGVGLDDARRDHIHHIVASHHGQYGRELPRTEEARLVAACDQVSGTEHRLAPVDANDILPLLGEGYRWGRTAVLLGVGRDLVKKRLREACEAEGVRDWPDLLPIWRRNGTVRSGTPEMCRQIARARFVLRAARRVPDSILERLSECSGARSVVAARA